MRLKIRNKPKAQRLRDAISKLPSPVWYSPKPKTKRERRSLAKWNRRLRKSLRARPLLAYNDNPITLFSNVIEKMISDLDNYAR